MRECCPICQREELDKDEAYRFLKQKYELTDAEIPEMIKEDGGVY